MTVIAAVSDLHGNLPDIPLCDILLIAGDVCPLYEHSPNFQYRWLTTIFKDWLLKQPVMERIVGIAGNHDFVFQEKEVDLPWDFLLDTNLISDDGWVIHGTPWQPIFGHWAFNADDATQREKFALIPKNVDILVSHGPPLGYGDLVLPYFENAGSHELLNAIVRTLPKYTVCGHIHGGYGRYEITHNSTLFNVSLLDEQYIVTNPVTVFEI